MTIIQGILFGFGFMIGILFFFIVCLVLLKGFKTNKNFTPEMFQAYLYRIQQQEKFEEIDQIKFIIKELKSKRYPKILKLFCIKSKIKMGEDEDNPLQIKIVKWIEKKK